ncbi:MAG TPA: hypothetical protein PLV89_12260 [Treponemataceae bacterium]|nr:hypothetical protein [Treponemataceae bacterium]
MKVVFKRMTHDYPKKAGDLSLAWYAGGTICICRNKPERFLQKQNLTIIQINALCKILWEELTPRFKKDLGLYALRYKKEYPKLRKRGVSSYAVFLMLIHALIKRFSLNLDNHSNSQSLLNKLLSQLSVKKAVELRLIKIVRSHYQLNHCNCDKLTVDLWEGLQDTENIMIDNYQVIERFVYEKPG